MTASTWKLPGYVIEECLGRGATGEVWRARIARTGQPVALKRVPAPNAAVLASVRSEAAMLSALDHPHLIRLHELVTLPDASVLVLDLADAGSLADLLRRRSRLTPGEVVTALAPIGAALAYAHAQGVVHGDVSTANVLFSTIGLPLLADLGVARIRGDDSPSQSTPAYVDPMVANGHLPGPSTDVFSLAAVAVHALRGHPIWRGDTAAEMIARSAEAASAPPLDIVELLPDTPDGVRAVIGRALVVEPHRRGTAAEFALDLRHSHAPMPVELNAGRARPEFVRPGDVLSGGVPDGRFTHGARAPAIGPLPRPGRRAKAAGVLDHPFRRLSVRQRRIATALVSAATVLTVVGFVLARPSSGVEQAGAASPTVTLATETSPAGPARPGRSPAVAAIADATSAVAVLTRLDQLREQAFARRDPQLLAQVYATDDLRAEDSATLTGLVGPGCTLEGLRTVYGDAQLAPALSGQVAIVVTATLSPSTLRCGRTLATVPGAAATRLRIELSWTGAGWLITDQQVVPVSG